MGVATSAWGWAQARPRTPTCPWPRASCSQEPSASRSPRRLQKGRACPDGDKCRCAHGQEELNEWLDRREVLKQKLAKARKDMLLCPRDDDFGKYNFLLRDDPHPRPEAPADGPAPGPRE